jgi:hypothetical protein
MKLNEIFKKENFKIQDYLLLAIKAVLIISIIYNISIQIWQIVSTNIFLLILTFIPQILNRSYKIKIPKEFEWALLVFVIISLFIQKLSGIMVPITFGIIMSLMGFMIMLMFYSSGQIKKNYFLIIVFAFNFAVVFGFGLEIIKYYLKIILGHELSEELYEFSMKNMTFIIIGAAFSSLMCYIYMKSKNVLISKIIDSFKKENPKKFGKIDATQEVLTMIKKGEDEKSEFKSTLRVNLYTNEIDKKIEHSVLKTINAFLNSAGGTLLIGITDKKEIIGIEKDRFENTDRFQLHLINLIKENLGKANLNLISIEKIKIKEKTIIKIEVEKSKKEVFLKGEDKNEEFYIRTGPSTLQLIGSELVDYIRKRFEKKKE